MKRMRFVHTDGYTDVAYTDDGSHILTCGSDGDVRIWEGHDDDDPTSHRVGDEATALAFKNGKIYVGTDLHSVQVYSYPAGLPDGIVSRFSANITTICVSKDGNLLASGSCDMLVKVTNLKTLKDFTLQGHSAPILSVHIDPKSEYLVSSSCDGTVRVWDLKQNGRQIKSFPWAPQSNDFSNSPTFCRAQFEPTKGNLLAIPVAASSSVKLIQRANWSETGSLTDDRLKDVSICSWSPCGSYLATATRDGHILVWNVSSKNPFFHFHHEKSTPICGLVWNPKPNCHEIVFTDTRGQMGVIENLLSEQTPREDEANVDELTVEDELSISITQIKEETGFIPKEDGDVFAGPVKRSIVSDLTVNTSHKENFHAAEPSKQVIYSQPKLQEPFQPGSSPTHLQNRYMMWNSVGVVRCYDDEDSESTIDVEFHDTSIHHALHMSNPLGYSMAALSEQALVLASDTQSDALSKISCLHFASWDTQKEWSISLPEGEEAIAVAVGQSWLAVATSRRLLRFFTLSGNQRGLVALPGSVVCMSGYRSQLLLVFHSAMSEQSLSYGILSIDRKSPVGYEWQCTPQPLGLGHDCYLAWAGFTDEGAATVMDSSGLISVLVKGFWVPVIDTKQHIKGKSDHYFVVGLSQTEQQLRCILCKGSRYPLTLPRPTLSLVQLQLPLCDLTTEKGLQEEALVRSSLLVDLLTSLDGQGFEVSSAVDSAEKSYKESLMKLFALACQSDREVRAVEAAEWMNTEQMLQLAVKYATRARRRHLADKLTTLAEQKNEEALASEINHSYDSYMATSQKKQARPLNDEDGDMFASQASAEAESSTVSDNPILLARQQQKVASSDPLTKPLSGIRKNPFAKTQVQDPETKTSSPTPKGSVVFDDPSNLVLVKSKTDTLTKENDSKLKTSKQTTLFSAIPKKTAAVNPATASKTTKAEPKNTGAKSGFLLWFEQNQSDLQDQHPDASSTELLRLGAKQFKDLPQDIRETYNNRKRKSEGETQEAPEKRSKPASAKEKLSTFAYNKED